MKLVSWNVAGFRACLKKGFEFVTGEKNKNRARVNREIIQTQKANQQFNWNGDFIFEPLEQVKDRPDVLKKAYVSTLNGREGVIRKFTPRECLRLIRFCSGSITQKRTKSCLMKMEAKLRSLTSIALNFTEKCHSRRDYNYSSDSILIKKHSLSLALVLRKP